MTTVVLDDIAPSLRERRADEPAKRWRCVVDTDALIDCEQCGVRGLTGRAVFCNVFPSAEIAEARGLEAERVIVCPDCGGRHVKFVEATPDAGDPRCRAVAP